MLTPINERSERALERWEKLRKSLGRAVSSVRPVQKGRFTIYKTSPKRASPRTPLKSGKYGRFEVLSPPQKLTKLPKLLIPKKNTRYYLMKKRNKIQTAVNAFRNAKKNKYQKEMSNLKARHKIEANNLEKKHQQNENNLYNKHFTNANKQIERLLRSLNNINAKLA
jgi:hypothetical protein